MFRRHSANCHPVSQDKNPSVTFGNFPKHRFLQIFENHPRGSCWIRKFVSLKTALKQDVRRMYLWQNFGQIMADPLIMGFFIWQKCSYCNSAQYVMKLSQIFFTRNSKCWCYLTSCYLDIMIYSLRICRIRVLPYFTRRDFLVKVLEATVLILLMEEIRRSLTGMYK